MKLRCGEWSGAQDPGTLSRQALRLPRSSLGAVDFAIDQLFVLLLHRRPGNPAAGRGDTADPPPCPVVPDRTMRRCSVRPAARPDRPHA